MSAAGQARMRRALSIALPLAGLVALGAYAYYQNHGPAPVQGEAPKGDAGAKAPGGPPAGAPVAVEVAAVKTTRLQEDATAIGTLRSNESVVVRPEISGRISRINFVEGRPVEKGQLLVALDASVHAAEVQQAKANLALAETNFNRVTELEREKFVSPNAKDQALNGLRVAQATLALADARLAKTEIRAPFAGVIGIRQVSVGDYVKEGQDLVTLEDICRAQGRLPAAGAVAHRSQARSDGRGGERRAARAHLRRDARRDRPARRPERPRADPARPAHEHRRPTAPGHVRAHARDPRRAARARSPCPRRH